jgi:putative oxidoreductase
MSTTTTTAATTPALNSYLPVLARLLMCSLFIWDGVLQLRNPAAAVDYFTSLNVPVPHIAVWVSIAVHLLGGAAILIGFMTRWAAALLILLCLGTAFGVHLPAGDMDNMMNFYKNLVMAGGFLYVINFGPWWNFIRPSLTASMWTRGWRSAVAALSVQRTLFP